MADVPVMVWIDPDGRASACRLDDPAKKRNSQDVRYCVRQALGHGCTPKLIYIPDYEEHSSG